MPSALDLQEGSQYNLTSVSDLGSPTTSVVNVKLTDAALKAFEVFYKSQSKKSQATIRFQGNQGAIKIPIPAGAGVDNGSREFGFSLSAINGNPNGSYQCIRQSMRDRLSRGAALEDIGSMSHKITVQGSDDSYQNTRVKMAQAEEESRKGGVKEIEQSGPNIGRRVKKVITPGNKRNGLLHTVSQAPSPKLPMVRQEQNTPRTEYISPRPPSVIPPPESQASMLAKRRPPAITSQIESLAAKRRRAVSPSPMPPKAKHHQEIGKWTSSAKDLSLRERVVHHLALRPYTKPELLVRLNRDGLEEKDKDTLVDVLTEVAQLNVKDNKYTLQRQLYGEVMINCTLYSDDDRVLLTRKLLQLNCAGSSTSPAVSPCHSAGKVSPATMLTNGDSTSSNYSTSHASKKQRVAHIKREATGGATNDSSLAFTASASETASTPHGRTALMPDVVSLLLDSTAGDRLDEDYLRLYTKITSVEQRQKYRRDFDREYVDYKDVYSRVATHMARFNELSQQVHEHQKGTALYEMLCKAIIEEYKLLKANQRYCDERKRCQYLHGKLDHVKRLVADYDVSDSHNNRT